jgi:hypothetical protein
LNTTNKDWQLVALTIKNSHPNFTTTRIAEMVGVPRTTLRDYFSRYYSELAIDKSDEMFPQIAFKEEVVEEYDNSRILFISDMHIPYHHPNTLPFLQMLKDRYNPTRTICLGDELDKHGLSFHDSDPDLLSAGDELQAALPVIAELHKMFPVMDLVDSNHGSLVWRKAKHHGIPRHYIKSYNDVLQVGNGWKWHNDLVLDLPDGQRVYVHHGKSADAIKTSQAMGMSHVCGHYHNSFGIKYWANPQALYWAINAGCLIDDESLAFAYNSVNLHRPIIGTCLIIEGVPVLEAMPL